MDGRILDTLKLIQIQMLKQIYMLAPFYFFPSVSWTVEQRTPDIEARKRRGLNQFLQTIIDANLVLLNLFFYEFMISANS